MPKVSVIVPVFGVERYIERCARSLFEQTLDDIEYIFIDDCTPDSSIEILKTILKEYPNRIPQTQIERMSKNSGQAAVRKQGIHLAKGDFIIHCDSDDWVESEMYEKMYETAIRDKSDLVVCDFQNTDGYYTKGLDSKVDIIEPKMLMRSMLYRKVSWSLCNKLIKSTIYAKGINFPHNNMGEDMVLVLQLTYYCQKISYINKAYYNYFSNPKSISREQGIEKRISRFQQGISNTTIIEDHLNQIPEHKYFKKALNVTKYQKKCFLDLDSKECRQLWRKTYPFVEIKILIDKNISIAFKKQAIKHFFQAYF